MIRASFLALVALFTTVACSSGSGAGNPGSTTGGNTSSCAEVCKKADELGCQLSSPGASCVQSCEQGNSAQPACVGVAMGATECLLDAYGCDFANYLTGSGAAQACPSQMSAVGSCIACEPDAADDDACATCSKASCCIERKGVYGDLELFALSECLQACADIACYDACNSQYPQLAGNVAALSTCEDEKCASACGAAL